MDRRLVDVCRLPHVRYIPSHFVDDTEKLFIDQTTVEKSKNNNDEIVPHAICAVAV